MRAPIFIDIDGTLLTSDKRLTDRTKEALHYARSLGHVIVLTSGRCYDGLKSVLYALDFMPWTATLNGAYIMDDKHRVIYDEYIPVPVLEKLLDIAKQTDNKALYFFSEHWGSDNDEKVYANEYKVTHQAGINDSLQSVMKKYRINKYLSTGTHEACLEFLKRVKEQYPSYEVELSSPTYVEVNTPGISKGKAVEVISKLLETREEDAICFGDYNNDMAMFLKAGNSVAMGNAVDEIKKVARFVTSSNDEEGLAKWIEKNLATISGCQE